VVLGLSLVTKKPIPVRVNQSGNNNQGVDMKFRIYITFDTGDQHLDTDWCDDQPVLRSLGRLSHGAVSKTGIPKEIKVVDEADCIVFLMQDDQVVHPKPEEVA